MQNCGEQLRAGNETRDGWLNPKSFICVGMIVRFTRGAESKFGCITVKLDRRSALTRPRGGASLRVIRAPAEGGAGPAGLLPITSPFSATIHKLVPSSTGFAQERRTLLLMKLRRREKVQSLQAWMTRCQ